jgi:hypothetical protein
VASDRDAIPLTRAAVTTDEHGRTICPVCGHPAINEKRLHPDEDLCTPIRCPAWSVQAVYDHDSRVWVPADPIEGL